jgi:hypothetical protein
MAGTKGHAIPTRVIKMRSQIGTRFSVSIALFNVVTAAAASMMSLWLALLWRALWDGGLRTEDFVNTGRCERH